MEGYAAGGLPESANGNTYQLVTNCPAEHLVAIRESSSVNGDGNSPSARLAFLSQYLVNRDSVTSLLNIALQGPGINGGSNGGIWLHRFSLVDPQEALIYKATFEAKVESAQRKLNKVRKDELITTTDIDL